MDISSRVDYELLFNLDILDPETDEPIGITMQIRSAGSEAVKKVQREHTKKNIERQAKNKLLEPMVLEKQELEKAAACIASWDWGINPATQEQNTYDGEVPELTMKTATRILEKEGWIFGQVVREANAIANFMPSSAKRSAAG